MIETCPQCKFVYKYKSDEIPMAGSLITAAFIDGHHIRMCPICYANAVLRIHGVMWEPSGEMASEMYELARRLQGVVVVKETKP